MFWNSITEHLDLVLDNLSVYECIAFAVIIRYCFNVDKMLCTANIVCCATLVNCAVCNMFKEKLVALYVSRMASLDVYKADAFVTSFHDSNSIVGKSLTPLSVTYSWQLFSKVNQRQYLRVIVEVYFTWTVRTFVIVPGIL